MELLKLAAEANETNGIIFAPLLQWFAHRETLRITCNLDARDNQLDARHSSPII
jgi:hypothetical protein